MASAKDEGRTEEPTQKQRDKFRNEGSVPKSQELNALSQYLVGYVLVSIGGGYAAFALGDIMRYTFTHTSMPNFEGFWDNLRLQLAMKTFVILVPALLILMLAVIAVNIAQFGLRFSSKALQPKWTKLNPFTNFKSVLISARALMELAKSLAKLTVLSYLVYLVFREVFAEFSGMAYLTPMSVGENLWRYASQIWIYFIIFMLVLGLGDAIFQRHQLNEQMKMTPQQVKDENKQSEGDPKVKQRQRQRAVQILREAMTAQIKQAQVVITNPTHFAVALAYEKGQIGAPKIAAKGMDHVALMIRKLARKNQVPIVENRLLARGLYWSSKVGQEIPGQFFQPVAEILAWIYKLNRQRGAS